MQTLKGVPESRSTTAAYERQAFVSTTLQASATVTEFWYRTFPLAQLAKSSQE